MTLKCLFTHDISSMSGDLSYSPSSHKMRKNIVERLLRLKHSRKKRLGFRLLRLKHSRKKRLGLLYLTLNLINYNEFNKL